MRYLFAALIIFGFNMPLQGQAVSSVGKQFFVSFYTNAFSNAPDVRLYLASKVNTSGTITNPNTGYSIPFSISANSSTVVLLNSAECVNNTPFTANNLGLIVNSNDSISVFARNITFASEDVSMILPLEALSTSYLITNTRSNDRFLGVFLIQATQDNTVVEIVPSARLNNGFVAGRPYTITLNRGQTYLGSGALSTDITGTTIKVLESCKPIAVFTGSPAAIIPFTFVSGAEHLYEQVLPDFMLGTEFVTPVLKNRNSSLVSITAAYGGTTLFLNGAPNNIFLDANTSFQFETSNTPQHISSNLPVQVAVFGNTLAYDTTRGPSNLGDPTFVMVSPIALPVKESFYSTPGNGPYPLLHGVSIICKTSDIGQMRLDGQPVGAAFRPVPGNIVYSHAIIDTDSGYHYLSNPGGFQAYASSTSFVRPNVPNGATSYGFNTSAVIEPIINHFSLNGFSSQDTLTAEVCPGTATFLLRVPQQDASFTWDFGDGSPQVTTPGSTLQQRHIFLQPGLYTVTLSIEIKCFPRKIVRKLRVQVRDEVTPMVKISTSASGEICEGTFVTFRANLTNAGVAPNFQWFVNGIATGINTIQFGPIALSPDDWVKCVVSNVSGCRGSVEAADSIQVKITPVFQPQVTVNTPATQVCSGSSVSLTAQTPTTYQNPQYQWIVNGAVSGANAPTFTYTPANNDRVFCVLTVADLCAQPAKDSSEPITITTITAANPTISIRALENDVCAGTAFRFTANASFAGANPLYNWLVNGVSTGVATQEFSSTLNNGDKVTCLLTSSLTCVTVQNALSNEVVAQVRQPAAPIITIGTPRTDICQQDSVFINTSVAGTSVVPTLQWFLNGNLFATNNSGALLLTNLKNNDTVSAQSIGGVDCLLPTTTNRLVFKVASPGQATVTIQSLVNGVCLGENISFTSVQTNGGNNPKYIWRVNGQQTTVDNSTLTLSKPAQDVRVQLELISSIACVTPVLSNFVEVRVFSLPNIQFSQPDTVIRLGTLATLSPSIQSSSPIARYVWSPAASLNNAFILTPQANPEVTTLYSLQATDQNNCSSQANFEVIVSGKLFMPNAFTPNNDGLNDQFAIPRTIFIDLKSFRVYNRWGQQVFETTNVRSGWDGTKNGMPLPSGTYAWVLQYRDAFTREEETLKGAVMLIR